MDIYDRDYYERGIETGKSCYQNYRWIPELTIPMAMTIIDHLSIKPQHSILDFGCAKGYLVKAFRWLNRECYGHDTSKYAIDNCDPEVKGLCFLDNPHRTGSFDFCIAKDVFEHIPLSRLKEFFEKNVAERYFAVIPLGKDGKFFAPANNCDVTHVNCMTEDEWIQFFADNYLGCERFTHRIKGIKDSYYEKYPTAHGFFTLCR
jgi:cyclopropane fatty-acyl-phospholipid synthase-like methyltransferase